MIFDALGVHALGEIPQDTVVDYAAVIVGVRTDQLNGSFADKLHGIEAGQLIGNDERRLTGSKTRNLQ